MIEVKAADISPDDVHASIEANFAKVSPEVTPLLTSLVKSTLTSSMPTSKKVIALMDIGARIGEVSCKHTACRNKCSHCCHMGVQISTVEAIGIAEYLGVPLDKSAAGFPPPDKSKEYMGVACPFLTDEEACSVYEVRPLICRTYMNISDYPELCDVKKNPNHETPSIDVSNILGAMMLLVSSQGYGDIHDYFPHVKGGKGI